MIHPDIRDALVIAARTRLVREEDHPEHMAALEVARQHGLCRLAPQPGTTQIGRARWMAATFLGTAVGATRHSSPFLVVQTRDGRVWPHCSPRCVRAA